MTIDPRQIHSLAAELTAPADFRADDAPTIHGEHSRHSDKQLKKQLAKLGRQIAVQQRLLWENRGNTAAGRPHSMLLVLQGMDTSGKDGTVRGVFRRTSLIGSRLESFCAPTWREQAHDFLWRIHRVTPQSGELVVFNRSHYEDILVPGVNQWIDSNVLAQRMEQINQFEKMLTDNGTRIVKCMLHISRDEQGRRLQARIDRPEKHWKFDPGDLDVRRQWDDYQQMYSHMIQHTSTAYAPWYIVPADSKPARNVMVASLVLHALLSLRLQPPPANPDFSGITVN